MRGRTVLVALVFLCVACAQTSTCDAPYMPFGQTCCLDRDANGICDADENASAVTITDGVNCETCPPRFVTQREEVVIYKYVCPDGTVTDAKDACGIAQSNAYLFTPNETQNTSLVTLFEARPACRGSFPSAELHLQITQSPARLEIQAAQDPQGPFTTLAQFNGSATVFDDEFFYLGLCSKESCGLLTDGQLPLSGSSVVRIELHYAERVERTRELLVDPSPGSEYGKKACA